MTRYMGTKTDKDDIATQGDASIGSFEAYRAAAWTVAGSSVATKISFDAETFDVSSWFDIATNVGRFTPQKAGYYQLSAYLSLAANIAAGNYVLMSVYKNGSNHREMNIVPQNSIFNPRLGGQATVFANGSTDYFEIYYVNSGAAVAGTTGVGTRFSGLFIGPS